jgi:hypothetical protein
MLNGHRCKLLFAKVEKLYLIVIQEIFANISQALPKHTAAYQDI